MEKYRYKVWLTIEKVDPHRDIFENVTEIDLGGFDHEEQALAVVDKLIEEAQS